MIAYTAGSGNFSTISGFFDGSGSGRRQPVTTSLYSVGSLMCVLFSLCMLLPEWSLPSTFISVKRIAITEYMQILCPVQVPSLLCTILSLHANAGVVYALHFFLRQAYCHEVQVHYDFCPVQVHYDFCSVLDSSGITQTWYICIMNSAFASVQGTHFCYLSTIYCYITSMKQIIILLGI